MNKVDILKRKVLQAEQTLQKVVNQLKELREELDEAEKADTQPHPRESEWKWPFREQEYERYGRQLIVPAVGIKGLTPIISSKSSQRHAKSFLPRSITIKSFLSPHCWCGGLGMSSSGLYRRRRRRHPRPRRWRCCGKLQLAPPGCALDFAIGHV
jgi:hypothetical protein